MSCSVLGGLLAYLFGKCWPSEPNHTTVLVMKPLWISLAKANVTLSSPTKTHFCELLSFLRSFSSALTGDSFHAPVATCSNLITAGRDPTRPSCSAMTSRVLAALPCPCQLFNYSVQSLAALLELWTQTYRLFCWNPKLQLWVCCL